MNPKQKALVMGFIEYLQGVYGEGGQQELTAPMTPPNSLLVPMFVGAEQEDMGPDFGAIGAALGADPASLLQQIDAVTGGAGGMPMLPPDMMV